MFPVSRDELFAYDVLIFGDANPSFLSRSVLDNIAAFVEERGGGLVVIAGPRHTPLAYRDTPLAKLLPINLDTAVRAAARRRAGPAVRRPADAAGPVQSRSCSWRAPLAGDAAGLAEHARLLLAAGGPRPAARDAGAGRRSARGPASAARTCR